MGQCVAIVWAVFAALPSLSIRIARAKKMKKTGDLFVLKANSYAFCVCVFFAQRKQQTLQPTQYSDNNGNSKLRSGWIFFYSTTDMTLTLKWLLWAPLIHCLCMYHIFFFLKNRLIFRFHDLCSSHTFFSLFSPSHWAHALFSIQFYVLFIFTFYYYHCFCFGFFSLSLSLFTAHQLHITMW